MYCIDVRIAEIALLLLLLLLLQQLFVFGLQRICGGRLSLHDGRVWNALKLTKFQLRCRAIRLTLEARCQAAACFRLVVGLVTACAGVCMASIVVMFRDGVEFDRNYTSW